MLKWTSQGSLASPRNSMASSPGRKPVCDMERISMASERSVSCRGSVSSLGSHNISPLGGSDVHSMTGGGRERQHSDKETITGRFSRGKVRANTRRASCSLPGSPRGYVGFKSEGQSQKKNVLTKVMKIFRKHKDRKEKPSGSVSQPTSPRRSLSFLSPEVARKNRGDEGRKKSSNTRLGRLIEAKRRERKSTLPDQAERRGSNLQQDINFLPEDKDGQKIKPKDPKLVNKDSNIMDKFLDSPPILSTFKGSSSSKDTVMPFESDGNTQGYHLAKQDLLKPRVKYSHHPNSLRHGEVKRTDGMARSQSMRDDNVLNVPRVAEVRGDRYWTDYRERSPLIRRETGVMSSETYVGHGDKRRTDPEITSTGDILSSERTSSPANLSKIRGVKVFHASSRELLLARSALSPVTREPSPLLSPGNSPSKVPEESQDKGDLPRSPETLRASEVKNSSQPDFSAGAADLAKTEMKNNNNGHHHKKAAILDEKPQDIFVEGCEDERIDPLSSFQKGAQREYSKRASSDIVQDNVFDSDENDKIVSDDVHDTDGPREIFHADVAATPARYRVRDIVTSLGSRMSSQNTESSSRRSLYSSNRFSDALNVLIDTPEEDSCGPLSPPSFTVTEGFTSYSAQDNKGSDSVSKDQLTVVGESTGFSPNFSEVKDWTPCDDLLTGGTGDGCKDDLQETTVGQLATGKDRFDVEAKKYQEIIFEPSPENISVLSDTSVVCSKDNEEKAKEIKQEPHLLDNEVVSKENPPTLTSRVSLSRIVSRSPAEVDNVPCKTESSFISGYEGLDVNHDRVTKSAKSTAQDVETSPDLSVSVCLETVYSTKGNNQHFESDIKDREEEGNLESGFLPSTRHDKTLPDFINESPVSDRATPELPLSENEPHTRTKFCKGEIRADAESKDVFVMPDCALEVNRDLGDLPLTSRMKKRVSFKLDQLSDADSTHSEDKALLDEAPSYVSAEPRTHVHQGEELCGVSVSQVRGDASSTDVSSSLFTDDEVPEPFGTGNVTSTSADDLSWWGGEGSEDPMLFCDEKLTSTVAHINETEALQNTVSSMIEIVAEQNVESYFQGSPHKAKKTKTLEQVAKDRGSLYGDKGKDQSHIQKEFDPDSEPTSVKRSNQKRHKVAPSRSCTEIVVHKARETETSVLHRSPGSPKQKTSDSSPEASTTHDDFDPSRISEQGEVLPPTGSSSVAWWDREAAQDMKAPQPLEGNEEEPIRPTLESSIAWWDKVKRFRGSEVDERCSNPPTYEPPEDATVLSNAESEQKVLPREVRMESEKSGTHFFEDKKQIVLTDCSPQNEKPEQYHDAVENEESARRNQELEMEKCKLSKSQDTPNLQGMPTVCCIPGHNLPKSGQNPSASPIQKLGAEEINLKTEEGGTTALGDLIPDNTCSEDIPVRLSKCIAETDLHRRYFRDKPKDSDSSDFSQITIGNDTTYPISQDNPIEVNNQTLSRWPKRTRILTQTSPFETSLKGVCILSDTMSCDGSGDCYDSSEDGCAYRDLLCNFKSRKFLEIQPHSEGVARDGIQCWPVRDSGKANPSWESLPDEAIGKQVSTSHLCARTPDPVATQHIRQRSSSSDRSNCAGASGRRRRRSGDASGVQDKGRSTGSGKKRRSHYTNTGQRRNSGRKQHGWNDQFPLQHSPQYHYDPSYQQQQQEQYYRESHNRHFSNQQPRISTDNSDLQRARSVRLSEGSNGEDEDEMSNEWLYFTDSHTAHAEAAPSGRSRKTSRGQETVEWLFLATFFVFQLLLHWIYAK